MVRKAPDPEIDRELAHLAPGARWRLWLQRIEAVLFASASPVPRADLARVVGQAVSVDLLIADLAADLRDRPYEVVPVGAGWMLRTRPAFAPVIRAAADVTTQSPDLAEFDMAVLAAIACHQPIGRAGLRDIFGRDISRDLIGRLVAQGLVGAGPREPRRGAPATFVTTPGFLAAFGLASLRDLPDPAEGPAETGSAETEDPATATARP